MPRTILIVDDNALDRAILKGFLNKDYTVIEAESVMEMISVLRRRGKVISAILLDLVMPNMDGFQALRTIGENAIYRQVPVIILSALNDDETQAQALSLGATGFAFKPYNKEIILPMLENTINLREKSALVNTLSRDALTGLLNRRAFFQQAADCIKSHEAGYYVMTCSDIENFKVINDQYGLDVGDKILKHIAKSISKEMNLLGGICCRDAADKFAMLYPADHVNSDEIKRLHNTVTTKYTGKNLKIRVGRYFVSDTSIPVSAMYDRATIAEESIKGRYDTYIAEYTEEMRLSLVNEQQVVNDMSPALEAGEFETWFQPQYNHSTGALIGAEALVRWRKDGKIVPPNEFIPIFERNGFIYEVDQYIWKNVCILLRRWMDEGRNPMPVSVNISRYDLLQKDFMDKICALTEEYKLPPDMLRLEVTESAFSKSSERVYAVVNELIEKGFTVEIDDFGSGYSSLNTLKDVPASILKLDMRFFERTGDAKRGGNIVESVVRMAKWLGMAVIAEGVEDKAQADYLKSIGCVYIQGYFYAKPMPMEEYEKRLDMSLKEAKLNHLQTLQHLDNNDFWDSHSMDTLIFNSYVGAACILELCKGRLEMLRTTDHYVKMLGGKELDIKDIISIDWSTHMDNRNIRLFTDAVMESLKTKDTVTGEYEFHDLPGCPETIIIRSILRVIAKAGDHILIYCLNENITAQRTAERAAQGAIERINAVMDNSRCGISAAIPREDGSVELIFVNNRFFELLGYTREQYAIEVKSPYDRVVPEDRDRIFNTVTNLNEIGSTMSVELREIRRDGSIIWLRCDASIVKFANIPEPVQLTSFLDITEQNESELKQLENAHQLEIIMSNINGGVSALQIFDDATSKFVFNNERYYELYGYTKEEALSEKLDIMTLILPEDIPIIMTKINQMKKDRQPCLIDYRIKKKDGSYALLRANASLMSITGYGDDVITSVVTDITENKSLEDRLDAIVDNINGGISAIYFKRERPEYALVNEQYYRILGYTKEEFEARNINPFDLLHPDDREWVTKKFTEMQKYGKRYTMEYRIIRRDGAVRHILCNTSVLKLFGINEPLQLAVSNDITELRETQRQEIAFKDRLNTVMNTMSNGITAVTVKGHIQLLFANDRYYQIHGVKPESNAENTIRSTFSMIHADDREHIRDIVMSTADVGHSIETEYRIPLSDGTTRYIKMSITTTHLIGVESPVQVAVYSDITDEKKANNQIRFLNDSAGEILAQPDSEMAINNTLRKLLNYFASDRTYIIELHNETKTSDNTYEFCAPGINLEIERLQGVSYETQQCWFDAFDKAGFVAIPDVAAITNKSEIAMRELLLKQGIRSIIVAPLWRDDKLIGYIGIDNPTKAVDQVSQLIALTDYIAILLTRRDLMKSIEHGRQAVQQLMDDTPGGFLRLRILPDGTPVIVSLNIGFCRMLGMTNDEVMTEYGDDAHRCMVTEDVETVKSIATQALAGNGMYTYKCRLKKKNGEIIWVQVFGRYVKDENGELFRNSFFTDITGQRSLEQQQIDLLDNLPFGAAMYEFDGKNLIVTHINKQYWKLVDRQPTKYEKTSVTDAIHPEDRGVVIQEIKAAIRQERNVTVNLRILNGNGGYSPFHITASVVPEKDDMYKLFAAYSPISNDEMSIQEMLPIALSTMVSSSEDMSYVKDKNLRYICVSQAVADIARAESPRDLIGKSAEEVFGEEYAPKFNEDDRHVIETGEIVTRALEHIPAADGSIRLAQTSKYPILNAAGHAIGIYCVSHDVTAQKERESQLELLTDTIPGGIATFCISPDNIEALYYNDGVCALAGYSREDYVAHPIPLLNFIFTEDRPIIREQIELLQRGETSLNVVFRISPKNGGYRWINAIARVTGQTDGVYSVNAVLTDVTKQQEESERLHLAEEEYRIATEHSACTICRYNIAEMSMKIAHEAATRLELPLVMQGVPYAQIENGSISPDTADNYIAFYERILNGEKDNACVYCKKLNNRWRWLSARSTSIFDPSGKPLSAIISFTDITEEQEKELVYKKWEQSLTERKSEQFTLYRCNLNKDASYDTKEGTLFGFAVEKKEQKLFSECTAEFCNEYVVEDDQNDYIKFLDSDRLLAGFYRGTRSGELIFRARLSEDDIRWIRLSVELLEYPNSNDVEAYLMYEDINDSVLEELQMKRLAETDSLTGLQNRKVFIKHVNKLLEDNEKNSCSALFLIDIDYFKHINDTFGHGVGDDYIVSMANVILSVIKEDGIVCRLGGDEFLGYLPGMPSRDSVADKARELCESAHIKIKNDIQISVSIGVALVTDDGENFDSMYHKADKALYHVKEHGKNNFAFYEKDMERTDNEVISDMLSSSLTPMSNGKNTMLVVDDSAINRMVTAGMFKNDFSIVEAENGQVALDYLRKHSDKVAIILLDIMMPVMDGYELLAVMKDDTVLQEVPVIVISGEDDRKASLRAIKAGAWEYIVKPIDAELLRLRVSSVLSKSENGKLRKQNDIYAVDSQELQSYRFLMESNATVLIEYTAKTGTFKYAPKTSTYLNGTFDERPIWQIFEEDKIASKSDVETIRKIITESDKPYKATFNLMTPDGTAHSFLMKVIMRGASENDNMVLITLTDSK